MAHKGFFWLLVVELRPVRVLGDYRSSSTADTGDFTTLRRRVFHQSVLANLEPQRTRPHRILQLAVMWRLTQLQEKPQ